MICSLGVEIELSPYSCSLFTCLWFPTLRQPWKSPITHFSRKNSVRRNSGLYKLGHGKKSVIWYWEFDMQRQYFHQFKTIDYAAAVEFYVANKFTMWEKKKGRPFRKQYPLLLHRCYTANEFSTEDNI